MAIRSIVAPITFCALCACGTDAPPAPTDTITLERTDLQVTVVENGELRSARKSLIRSSVEGLKTILYLVPEGTHVNDGDTLVELDVSGLRGRRSMHTQAVARIEGALAALESGAQPGSLRAELRLASERLTHLNEQIGNAVIRSPMSGTAVYASAIREGAMVRERQALIVVTDLAEIEVRYGVIPNNLRRVAAGQRATIAVDALPESEFSGVVAGVEPTPDGSRAEVTVTLDGGNPDLVLRPSMAAEVTIGVAELRDVLAVPVQAVRHDGVAPYVWKHTDAGPVTVVVQPGGTDGSRVAVQGELEAGDEIYLSPPR